MPGEDIIGAVVSIFFALVLIYVFVQVLWQIGAGYAILFFILSLAMVVGVVSSMIRR